MSSFWLKASSLNEIVLEEEIDIKLLTKLLEVDKLDKLLTEDETNKVKKYIRLYGSKKIISVKYKFGKGKKWGRVYCSLSAGEFWNRVKATILSKDYVDIDMENSGIKIIYQLGRRVFIEPAQMPRITKYIENRENTLLAIMTVYGCGRSIAKQLPIILSYGGTVYTWAKQYSVAMPTKPHKNYVPDFITEMQDEINLIAKTMVEYHPDLLEKIKTDESGNVNGTILAEVYQSIECRCLDILYKCLGSPKKCFLQHDGITVHKSELECLGKTVDELMAEVKDKIKDVLKVDVKYIEKPFKEPIELYKVTETEAQFTSFDLQHFNELLTYEDKKQYFEIFHYFIIKPAPVYIGVEFNKKKNKNEYVAWNEGQLVQAYKAYKVIDTEQRGGKNSKEDVEVKKLFITKWIDDENKRVYNDFDFIPENRMATDLTYWNGVYEYTYNSFNGYSKKCIMNKKFAQAQKDKILTPWTDIVFELCGADIVAYNAYLNFLAHMIQKPNEKLPMCFILGGNQGTGKSLHLKPLEKLLEDYYISSSNIQDFFGNHANGFYRKLLVNLNECQMTKNAFDYEGKIKSFISEDTITLNEKFEKAKTVRNVSRVIITTNKPNPIPIDVRTVLRRFNVFRSTDKFLDKKKYGKKFWEKCDSHFTSDDFISVFYEFLNNRDISNANLTKTILTKQYVEMFKHYIPPEVLFMEHFITTYDHPDTKNTIPELANNRVESITLYNKYVGYCESFGVRKETILTHHKFSLNLTELQIGIELFKDERTKYFSMEFDKIKTIMIQRQYIVDDSKKDDIVEDCEEDCDDYFDYSEEATTSEDEI